MEGMVRVTSFLAEAQTGCDPSGRIIGFDERRRFRDGVTRRQGTGACHRRGPGPGQGKSRLSLEFLIVGMHRVHRRQGVVARDPVLGGQHGAVSLRVLEKQGIVAHAETEDDVEVGLLAVENLGLQQGVAHRLEAAGTDLLRIPDADALLGYGSAVARHRGQGEPVGLDDVGHHAGFFLQAAAEGQSQFLAAQLGGEFHGFLDSRLDGLKHVGTRRPVGVALAFLDGGQAGEFTDRRRLVAGGDRVDDVAVMNGGTKIRGPAALGILADFFGLGDAAAGAMGLGCCHDNPLKDCIAFLCGKNIAMANSRWKRG